MPLPSPHLDDRRFQDLVDDAKRFIQRRCPEWTDHNVSDPGVALVEAFAQMVDQLVYRLNRVPEKVHLGFLDLLDLKLTAPQAARADVTFWLSAPQDTSVVVPAGTEVATPRAGSGQPCVFTVDRDLEIVPTAFQQLGTAEAGHVAVLVTERFAAGDPVTCFSQHPVPGDTLLIGLTQPAPRCAVVLRMDCALEGVGISPTHPPLLWEARCGQGWERCEVQRDTTGGLNRPGEVVLHLPDGHISSLIGRRRAAWLRCRVVEAEAGRPAYSSSPRISRLEAFTIGGTTSSAHGEVIRGEDLGSSDGTPGQSLSVERLPIVSGSLRTVLTHGTNGTEEWAVVTSFADSRPDDRHVRVDEALGLVQFGPVVRGVDGAVHQHGAVPAAGARVSAAEYRTGGGRGGNVGAGALTVLRTPLATIARTENRAPATGGVDAETVESVKLRAAQWLRTQRRAVTAGDYAVIARTACREAGRIECVEADKHDGHGLVRVLVVPDVPEAFEGADWRTAVPSPAMLSIISQAVEARRPLGIRVAVSGPAYQGVTVVAGLDAAPGQDPDEIRERALDALHAFLSPLPAADGRPGWPLGRPLRSVDLHATLASVPGVDAVGRLEMYPADPTTGERSGAAQRIELKPAALFLSYRHQVSVVPSSAASAGRWNARGAS
ncbi:putative baseplate assembly protein [Streptomyces sp. NPDC050658]|uniref:putative baseplate assembly protein n=1 Tax=unclassified Streptomyces TaxID=2593676 RepID=UPI0034499B15